MGASAQLAGGQSQTDDFISSFPNTFSSIDYQVNASLGAGWDLNATYSRATSKVEVIEQSTSGTRLKFTVAVTAIANAPDLKLGSASASARFSIIVTTQKRTYFTWTESLNGDYPAYVLLRDGIGGSLVSIDNSLKSTWLEAGRQYEFYFSVSSLLNTPVSIPTTTFTLDEAGPPPPPPPPPALALPESGAILYHGVPQAGYIYDAQTSYGIAIGDWWSSGLSGQPWTGSSSYRPYGIGSNGVWTNLVPDHDMHVSAALVRSPAELSDFAAQIRSTLPTAPVSWLDSNLYSGPVVFAFSADAVHDLQEPLELAQGLLANEASAGFSDTNACLVAANYGASGSWQTSNISQGFMLAIGAGEPLEVSYVAPPKYPGNVVASFELPTSGESVILERGTHYFGVLASYSFFPPIATDPIMFPHNPFRGGDDVFVISVKTLRSSVPNGPPPRLTKMGLLPSGFTLEWSDKDNRSVHVQRRASWSSGTWQTIGSHVKTKTFTDTNTPSGSAFYRLLIPAQ